MDEDLKCEVKLAPSNEGYFVGIEQRIRMGGQLLLTILTERTKKH